MAVRGFRHIGLKVVSIALAALLWLVVSGEQIVERALRIPLEFTNLPAQLELVGEPPTVVDVRVRGSSGALEPRRDRRAGGGARPADRAAGPAAVPPDRRPTSGRRSASRSCRSRRRACRSRSSRRRRRSCRSCRGSRASRRRLRRRHGDVPIRRRSRSSGPTSAVARLTAGDHRAGVGGRRDGAGDRDGERRRRRSVGAAAEPRQRAGDGEHRRRAGRVGHRRHSDPGAARAWVASQVTADARSRCSCAVRARRAGSRRRGFRGVDRRRGPAARPVPVAGARRAAGPRRRHQGRAAARAGPDSIAKERPWAGCSEPMACAARRASIRSTSRRCGGSAPRSVRALRPRSTGRPVPRRPRHARVGRLDRARAGVSACAARAGR